MVIEDVNRSQLAKSLGVNLAHISRIFSGKSRPSLEMARRIAEELNITVEELCDMIGVRPQDQE